MDRKQLDETNQQPGGNSRIVLSKVAEMSGVSISTVSRVLNGNVNVAPDTRAKVLNSISALGYVSTRLINERTGLIALTSSSMRGDYYPDIIAGVVEELHYHNARPVICPIPMRYSVGMPLPERIMQTVTEGALLLGFSEDVSEVMDLKKHNIPFVLVDPGRRVPDGLPVVSSTNEAGARQAVGYLLTLGHKRIGAIVGADWEYRQERLAGYRSTLTSAGLPVRTDLIVEGDSNMDSGYRCARQLLNLPERPSAIFAFNDFMAIGALRAAHECGIAVPDELSIVGFDDLAPAQYTTPALTTVHQSLMEIGHIAVDTLFRIIEQIKGGGSLQEIALARTELSTHLVIRGTTAPVAG
ncbi:LacI family DNA-binding transcriptional regulator [Dictyobacter aurantiacus]|uniref:Transcriptional regulator n=1 Tax=Dictyobacter aurantiacus TaxID=1936993 RepID=A0A401Z7Z9_9CHLR|nr:LacI family DNA-binding transcriptional regulator [Dictyobacter aurantiacus]GCE02973.1 transcriptional regulator [Dictyobacter aurantiacus]